MAHHVDIETSWKQLLQDEFGKEYFQQIVEQLHQKKQAGERIYPLGRNIFRAFEVTPWDKVRVVILWQDPYHGPWQAHGLSFSVPPGVTIPPSLRNIFKEIIDDIWWEMPTSGDLTARAHQGVLLLNAILTVTGWQPASHHHLGRQTFTDQVIRHISQQKKDCVFLLWWNFAKEKATLIDNERHLILTASHPSPYAAHQWFFGSRHFSRTNQWLREHGGEPIVRLPQPQEE